MEESKIIISQIGIGYWGPNLLRNLVANENCEVRTVVDLSKERRGFVKSLYPSLNVSDNIDEIIKDKNTNAVIIATPVETHFNLAIKCLEAGKHILVEKPMATTSDEVKKIDQLSQKNNLIAMVGHTFLYNNTVRTIKKLIDDGEIGNIRYIYSQRVNLGRIRSDVDALWNLAPHDISIMQYWLDEPNPIQVDRYGMSFVQEGIDDVAFMNIKYSNSLMANIHVSWLDPRKIRRMTVVGSKKMIFYDDIAENKIKIFDKGIDRMAVLGENMDFDNGNAFTYQHRSGDVLMPKVNWIEPLKTEIIHFIDCIQNGTQCITDAKHAEKVVRILEMGSK